MKNFMYTLALALILLKKMHQIDISWFWALSPLVARIILFLFEAIMYAHEFNKAEKERETKPRMTFQGRVNEKLNESAKQQGDRKDR